MTPLQSALKEPLQEILQAFAYLEAEAREAPANAGFSADYGARVTLEPTGVGYIVLLAAHRLVVEAADNFTGCASSTKQWDDVIRELANIVAGRFHAIVRHSHSPAGLGIPSLLNRAQAQQVWQDSSAEQRLVLCDESAAVGGLVWNIPEDWCREAGCR
jgi:hypothetical protein